MWVVLGLMAACVATIAVTMATSCHFVDTRELSRMCDDELDW